MTMTTTTTVTESKRVGDILTSDRDTIDTHKSQKSQENTQKIESSGEEVSCTKEV